MVTTLKIGRRKHKNILAAMADEMKGFLTMQSNMWVMCTTAATRLKRAAERDLSLGDDNLAVTIRYEKNGEDDPDYEIEWMIVDMSAPMYEREYEAYMDLDKFNDTLRKNYNEMKSRNGIVINKPKFKMFDVLKDKFKLSRENIENWIDKGLDKEGSRTISDYLLELDILLVKIPPEQKNSKEEAYTTI